VPIPEVWAKTVGVQPEAGACPAGGPQLQLTPAANGTDGFFVAVLERRVSVDGPEPAAKE